MKNGKNKLSFLIIVIQRFLKKVRENKLFSLTFSTAYMIWKKIIVYFVVASVLVLIDGRSNKNKVWYFKFHPWLILPYFMDNLGTPQPKMIILMTELDGGLFIFVLSSHCWKIVTSNLWKYCFGQSTIQIRF